MKTWRPVRWRRINRFLDRHPFDIDAWLNGLVQLGAVAFLAIFLVFVAHTGRLPW